MTDLQFTAKYIGSTLAGVASCALVSSGPLIILCAVLVIIDCITSWRLSVRLKKQGKPSVGKIRSDKLEKAILNMTVTFPTAILIAYFTQLLIFEGVNLHLPQIIAGVICFRQFWSILENISSANPDARWAKLLQMVLIDKSERHLSKQVAEYLKESSNMDANASEEKKTV